MSTSSAATLFVIESMLLDPCASDLVSETTKITVSSREAAEAIAAEIQASIDHNEAQWDLPDEEAAVFHDNWTCPTTGATLPNWDSVAIREVSFIG